MSQVEDIISQYHHNQELYGHMVDDIEDIIGRILSSNQIKVSNFAIRIKSEETLRKKIMYKHKYHRIEDITDVVACRLITLFESDLDLIVKLLFENFDVVEFLDKRQKQQDDHVGFGYNSIHMIVRFTKERCALVEYAPYRDIYFEIQLRTALQHAWAEVEHGLGYKNEYEIPSEIRRRLNRLSASLELLDEEFVRINEDIQVYNQSLEREEKVLKTDINRHSLETYALHCPNLKKLVNELADMCALTVYEDPQMISELRIVRRFHYLGYLYIHEVDELIQKHAQQLKMIGKEWIRLISNKEHQLNYFACLVWVSMMAMIENGKDDPDEILDQDARNKIANYALS
ncbi:MAG TPA: hypothetical protein IAD15_00040 [Candidatus Fimiplasma intestinipullorum]|uniref:RelA/SpoT domain-containing protein n=1 Tax=Candidatus Fimiplasma intestinipullorum TaxID=2840825 RepID=A0A9D1HKR8_9FIRM|nr:hypothetical protein [Candidatus Fimiplasma intestinipullorum]